MGKARVRIEINELANSARIFCGGMETGTPGRIVLTWLDLWMRFNSFYYIDSFISSTEPFIQAWFVQHGWKCIGFFPLFFPNVVTNSPEDAVMFQFPTTVRTKMLTLTKNTLEVARLSIPKAQFYTSWNAEHEFATLLNKRYEQAHIIS